MNLADERALFRSDGCSDSVNSRFNPISIANDGILNTLQLRDSVGFGTNLSPSISVATGDREQVVIRIDDTNDWLHPSM